MENDFLKNLEEIPLSLIKSRKKVKCFYGLHENKQTIFFISNSKSRILKKEFIALNDLVKKLETLKKIEHKVYFFVAPICSKALDFANEDGWEIKNVSM